MCFNLHGYYDLLKEMLQQMQTAGFVSESEMEHVFFPSTMTEIVSLLK
jgi:hypothetical protein